ncbi:hypothetical protein AbraIFM66950_004576 [Aspergillus brasiliensis]|nr:hypothetical protein AbraIFM66950_004576 [Aspergillus brasiliensis]
MERQFIDFDISFTKEDFAGLWPQQLQEISRSVLPFLTLERSTKLHEHAERLAHLSRESNYSHSPDSRPTTAAFAPASSSPETPIVVDDWVNKHRDKRSKGRKHGRKEARKNRAANQ